MLFTEIMAVYCEDYTKHIRTLSEQNAEFLDVKSDGTCSNRFISEELRCNERKVTSSAFGMPVIKIRAALQQTTSPARSSSSDSFWSLSRTFSTFVFIIPTTCNNKTQEINSAVRHLTYATTAKWKIVRAHFIHLCLGLL